MAARKPATAAGMPNWMRPVHRQAAEPASLLSTPGDVAICQDLTRFYALTGEQLTRRHFHSTRAAGQRLQALAGAGYVALKRPWQHGPDVYVVTPAGASLAGLGLPAPAYQPGALRRRLAVADLSDALLHVYEDAEWTCERELRQLATGVVCDRRRGHRATGAAHVPDGVLATRSGTWAVEVVLVPRPDAEYLRLLRWYVCHSRTRRVLCFAGTEPLRARLAALVEREQLGDLVVVEPLPASVTVPAAT